MTWQANLVKPQALTKNNEYFPISVTILSTYVCGFFLIEPNKLFAFTRFNVHILVLKPLPKPNHVGPNSVEIV